VRRREFIGLLGGATAWPLAVHAQQSAIPVIGFLRPGQPPKSWIEAFPQGLRELGYVDGQNVVVDFRSTDGSVDQLPQLIDELMRRKVNVILASGQLLRQRRKLPRRCPSSSWV
jgi:putative tryptophan/tyrosine transport system substrate-binding protein